MKHLATCVLAAAAVSLTGPALAGERAKADVQCQATAAKLIYDCTIMLMGKKSGAPIAGAEITIKADMATMAMAHNVVPVKAVPGAKPGHYVARLELEMYGEWTLTLDVSGPTRDRVVKKLLFGTEVGQAGPMRTKMQMKMKAKE